MSNNYTINISRKSNADKRRGVSSASVSSTSYQPSSSVGHSHPNKTDLDKITTDHDGYIHINRVTDDGTAVVEKVRAGYSDEAGLAHDVSDDVRSQFLSSTSPDEADGHITFNAGLTSHDSDLGAITTHGATPGEAYARLLSRLLIGDYNGANDELARNGGTITPDGSAELGELLVRSLMRVTSGVFRDLTSSNPIGRTINGSFVDGFNGHGMRLWHDDTNGWSMTLDSLTVRNSMRVFELVVQRVRSVGGQLIVSPADGKIDSVREVTDGTTDYYLVSFEDVNQFRADDIMRCHRWRGGWHDGAVEGSSVEDNSSTLKNYHVAVDYSFYDSPPTIYGADGAPCTMTEHDVLIARAKFVESITTASGDVMVGSIPESGDECVLMGNASDASRQNYISITASDDGVPRIDVMTGCNAPGTAGNLSTRLGCLDGIIDNHFADNPHGYGLYSDNAYIRGNLVVASGGSYRDVGASLEVLDDMVRASVSATRDDLIGKMGHLRNNTFAEGLRYWSAYVGGDVYTIGGHVTGNASGIFVGTGYANYARLVTDDRGMSVLEIKADTYDNRRGIRQANERMRDLPTDGEVKRYALSIYARAIESSTLYARVGGGEELSVSLSPSDEYILHTWQVDWDGTGDVELYGVGHIRCYGAVLTTKLDESMLTNYMTQITQTADRIETMASASRINPDTGVEETIYLSQLVQEYDAYKVSVSNQFSGVNASIEASVADALSNISISADSIDLRGYTTINGGFRIDEVGNMWAQNATIEGVLNNLIQTKRFSGAGSSDVWDFNPLEWGSVIEWYPSADSVTHILRLPSAMDVGGSMLIDSGCGMTMRELRQCIGKRFTIMCNGWQTAQLSLECSIIVMRRDYITGTNNEFDLSLMTTGGAYERRSEYTPYTQLTINGDKYITLECLSGNYGGKECIYWEVVASYQRGEVTYAVRNEVPITIDGAIYEGAIEFDSATYGTFRTQCRGGLYTIHLFASDYDVIIGGTIRGTLTINPTDETTIYNL